MDKSLEHPIYVTQPDLPDLNDFIPYLTQIWENKRLTNNGPFHEQFETDLCQYLGVPNISLFANGTLALVTALQALRITGEVITTPYTFVATSHALLWNGIKPVFVDIDPETMNLDPDKIEAAITPQTTAILPVHCYGTPCDIDRIAEIADTYGLKVIYDAAHAFGVTYHKRSIFNFGDIAIVSFHATKVFNTFEGGAIICSDPKLKQRIDYLKNFGFADETTVIAPGINGKMSEFNAALGILQLQRIEAAIEKRRHVDRQYRNLLDKVPGIRFLQARSDNFSYLPLLVDDTYPLSRDQLYDQLKAHQIHVRRYFYPLISNYSMYRSLPSASSSNLAIANSLASKVICLPIYPDLKPSEIELIASIIIRHAETASQKNNKSKHPSLRLIESAHA